MLNFKNVKVILFDFDETLCIHHGHIPGTGTTDEFADLIKEGADIYKNKEGNIQLKKFIVLCKNKGIEIGIISACSSFIAMNVKRQWAERTYSTSFTNYCVDSAEHKINMLEAIHKAYGFQRSQIAIVDDLIFTVTNAADAGFLACTPMEIVNFMNAKEWT